mmetsp:Transcript_50955/g.110314  ORF Transcript_50955/g.110314 Transcript_50955/m.110314 type:complete len:273 (-) Transcript_50955:970-1788(-)
MEVGGVCVMMVLGFFCGDDVSIIELQPVVFVDFSQNFEGLVDTVLMTLDLEGVLCFVNFGRRDPRHRADVVADLVGQRGSDGRRQLDAASHKTVNEALQLSLCKRNLIGWPGDVNGTLLTHNSKLGASGTLNFLDDRFLTIRACLNHDVDTDVASERKGVRHFGSVDSLALIMIMLALMLLVAFLVSLLVALLPLVALAIFVVPRASLTIPRVTPALCTPIRVFLGLDLVVDPLFSQRFGFFTSFFVMAEYQQPVRLARVSLQETECTCFLF